MFEGYEDEHGSVVCAADPNGWFDTGDLGYLDAGGYLFINGRSKEIINRGGEVISPFEVEEAMMHCPLIKDCLAFSAPHDLLQETVRVHP